MVWQDGDGWRWWRVYLILALDLLEPHLVRRQSAIVSGGARSKSIALQFQERDMLHDNDDL